MVKGVVFMWWLGGSWHTHRPSVQASQVAAPNGVHLGFRRGAGCACTAAGKKEGSLRVVILFRVLLANSSPSMRRPWQATRGLAGRKAPVVRSRSEVAGPIGPQAEGRVGRYRFSVSVLDSRA
ncbi:hypothetical protein F4802DRAFT_514500 [Xylaria palmicola]|nr:hypothetical protein F4802DRAFT_514500 [Xylaria palmicola]